MLLRPLKLRDIPLILMFIGSWIIMTWIALLYDSGREMTPVPTRIPDDFPVLVVSEVAGSYYAKIVLNYSLEEYVSGLKSYSLLVPQGKAEELNRQLARGVRYEDRFEVRQLAKGKQYLTVVWHWRGGCNVETGWYVAESRSFVPKYHQSGTVPVFSAVLWSPFTLTANILLWLIGRFVHRGIMRRQGAEP